MLNWCVGYEYIASGNVNLFTVILLPKSNGKFPVVIMRTPYVDKYENEDESNIAVEYLNENKEWLKNGYAVVIQHCRGRGKSSGDFIPYVNEREDGLNLQQWIRKQDFYNGELYLKGNSYTTSVHYLTAPFADDIKGAIFGVQDSERYNVCYRNGIFKKMLHGAWYVSSLKAKSKLKKNYTNGSFDILPMKDFSKIVFGEKDSYIDNIFKSPNPDDEFWCTVEGGIETKNVTDNVNFPVLLVTGFYDIYTGGIFDMWNKMSEESKKISAFVVSPYDHTDTCEVDESIVFENGKRIEQFGLNYEIDWFNYIRGNTEKSPFKTGNVTYYRLFENVWKTDTFQPLEDKLEIKLGENEVSYVYNPYDAPQFSGGLSRTFGGAAFQEKPNSRHDIISVYSKPFKEEVFVKGKMSAKLKVKSDCEDTCFYVRISITKEKGDFGLRDDITTLCYQLGDYTPNSVVDLSFEFDEHAFLVKKGEKLRIDIASADNRHYVRHTNNKGLYSEQTTAKVANNTVYLQESYLTLPAENKND